MRRSIRLFLGAARWPLGGLALLGLPAAFRSVQDTISPLVKADMWPFWVGLCSLLALWFWRWRYSRWGRFITTIEHESLHAIIGMLTLIPVRELKVREDGSGHVLFEPPGHWLLYLAPYFIPLLLVIEIALVRLLQLPSSPESALLGAILAISLLGHLRQLHPRQTDFRHAGIAFSIIFLPTAFLMCYGAAFTLLRGGTPTAVLDFLSTWGAATWNDAVWLWEALTSKLM